VYAPLERTVLYGRLPVLRPVIKLISTLRARRPSSYCSDVSRSLSPEKKLDDSGKKYYQWLNTSEIYQAGNRISNLILHAASKGSVERRRRKNFSHMLSGLSNVAGGHPLYTNLEPGVVPYMFPFLLDTPEIDFPALKEAKIPIWRWEELAESDCAVSKDYRLRLLQLPCHQELTEAEINWMIECIRNTIAK